MAVEQFMGTVTDGLNKPSSALTLEDVKKTFNTIMNQSKYASQNWHLTRRYSIGEPVRYLGLDDNAFTIGRITICHDLSPFPHQYKVRFYDGWEIWADEYELQEAVPKPKLPKFSYLFSE